MILLKQHPQQQTSIDHRWVVVKQHNLDPGVVPYNEEYPPVEIYHFDYFSRKKWAFSAPIVVGQSVLSMRENTIWTPVCPGMFPSQPFFFMQNAPDPVRA
jgi:hypothetical protein